MLFVHKVQYSSASLLHAHTPSLSLTLSLSVHLCLSACFNEENEISVHSQRFLFCNTQSTKIRLFYYILQACLSATRSHSYIHSSVNYTNNCWHNCYRLHIIEYLQFGEIIKTKVICCSGRKEAKSQRNVRAKKGMQNI